MKNKKIIIGSIAGVLILLILTLSLTNNNNIDCYNDEDSWEFINKLTDSYEKDINWLGFEYNIPKFGESIQTEGACDVFVNGHGKTALPIFTIYKEKGEFKHKINTPSGQLY